MYKVFLADDERWITIGIKKLIEKSGRPFWVAGEAYNGVTTLEAVEEKRPDVLFTDIRMPGLDGLELLAKLNERVPDTKVVIISGYAEFEYARRALEMHAYGYLLKPVEQEKLNEILDSLDALFQKERGVLPEKEAPEPASPTTVKKIVKEIQDCYTENISLSGLAEKYGFSIGYVSALVKEELGLSFSEYVTCKRIQKAKELLADPCLSIDVVAEQSGYHDYFYFTKVFKKVVGISPSKYRKDL